MINVAARTPGSSSSPKRRGGPRNGPVVTMTRNAAPSGPTSIKERRSEEHTSELQSHRDLHSFPTRRFPISGKLELAKAAWGSTERAGGYDDAKRSAIGPHQHQRA